MKLSEFKVSISVASYDEKTAENYWNCYVAESCVVSKMLKVSILNFISANRKLEWRLCRNFTSLYFILSEKWAIKQHHRRVGPGWFIVLNDSANASEFKIFISVKSYDEKTAENYKKIYVAEKPIVFKLWIYEYSLASITINEDINSKF